MFVPFFMTHIMSYMYGIITVRTKKWDVCKNALNRTSKVSEELRIDRSLWIPLLIAALVMYEGTPMKT